MAPSQWNLAFNYIGLVIGAVSVVWVYASLKSIGGKLAAPMYFVILGILLQMIAFLYTVIFSLLKVYPAPKIDFHHGIMTLGMISFVVAAKKFADLAK